MFLAPTQLQHSGFQELYRDGQVIFLAPQEPFAFIISAHYGLLVASQSAGTIERIEVQNLSTVGLSTPLYKNKTYSELGPKFSQIQ